MKQISTIVVVVLLAVVGIQLGRRPAVDVKQIRALAGADPSGVRVSGQWCASVADLERSAPSCGAN